MLKLVLLLLLFYLAAREKIGCFFASILSLLLLFSCG